MGKSASKYHQTVGCENLRTSIRIKLLGKKRSDSPFPCCLEGIVIQSLKSCSQLEETSGIWTLPLPFRIIRSWELSSYLEAGILETQGLSCSHLYTLWICIMKQLPTWIKIITGEVYFFALQKLGIIIYYRYIIYDNLTYVTCLYEFQDSENRNQNNLTSSSLSSTLKVHSGTTGK